MANIRAVQRPWMPSALASWRRGRGAGLWCWRAGSGPGRTISGRGYAAAGKGFKGVVNDIEVEGLEGGTGNTFPVRDNTLEGSSLTSSSSAGASSGAPLPGS